MKIKQRNFSHTWLLIIVGILLLFLVFWLISKRDRCDNTIPNPAPSPEVDKRHIKSDSVIIPGNPTILADRINIMMDDDMSIDDFLVKFKELYPDDKYEVIYKNADIKIIQIKVPQEERIEIEQKISEQLGSANGLNVFEEVLFKPFYHFDDPMLNDTAISWYLKAVNAFEAWDITMGSPDITIAIVDNGFNLHHPELKDKVVMPYNVWTHSEDVFPQADDHGTHVAGIALASANNNTGLCGIAPGCKFMPIQVADNNGMMTTTSVLDGILYAVNNGADVINVSLGVQFAGLDRVVQYELLSKFQGEERLWRKIEKLANSKNIAIVKASGNDFILAGVEPMNRPYSIITVSATDKSNNITDFTDKGWYLSVSAPGVDILSSYGSNDYKMLSGTSMAAPIVAGSVALIKSINDTITNEQIICVMENTGIYSHISIAPIIQIDEALKKVQSGEYRLMKSSQKEFYQDMYRKYSKLDIE